MAKSCPRCKGWIYTDLINPKKIERWCLMCGEWIAPIDFKPLPYVAREDETFKDANDWYIDEHGDIIDIIDRKIEEYIRTVHTFTVSAVAKKINCAISEARMTLDRLIRNGSIEKFTYGPQDRWTGYRTL